VPNPWLELWLEREMNKDQWIADRTEAYLENGYSQRGAETLASADWYDMHPFDY
jgi:hypothetical protein